MSILGVEGPTDENESGDPGVSVIISMEATGDEAGEAESAASIAKT